MITPTSNIADALDNELALTWLVKITLDASTKYWTNSPIVISGTTYEIGKWLADGFGEIDESIDLIDGGNVGVVDDFSIDLNEIVSAAGMHADFFPHSSAILLGRKVELGIVHNTGGTISSSDVLWIFAGYVNDVKSTQEKYRLQVFGINELDNIKIPTRIITKTEYPNAPEENIGKAMPFFFGDFLNPQADFDQSIHRNHFLIPGICVDRYRMKFIFASHPSHTLETNLLYFRTDSMLSYGFLRIETSSGSFSNPTTDDDDNGLTTATVPSGILFIFYWAVPSRLGNKNSSSSADLVIDKDVTNESDSSIHAFQITDLPDGKFYSLPNTTLNWKYALRSAIAAEHLYLKYYPRDGSGPNTIEDITDPVGGSIVTRAIGGGNSFLDGMSSSDIAELQFSIYTNSFNHFFAFAFGMQIIIAGEKVLRQTGWIAAPGE